MQFLFYDLETSGRSAKWQRIMQFGAQRTDENLKLIGEPVEHLITLTDEILPEPAAIMLTGITPQQTKRDGLNEAEFWREVYPLFTEGETCVLGFNSIRFDDEFLRYSLWRNFRDPYAWAWENGNSRWDLLDVARTTRALRPEGLDWPVDETGGVTSRLEALALANNLRHEAAHSALGDVNVTIKLARLLKKQQPKLWQWLLGLRLKKTAQAFIEGQDGPFVYISGSYPKEQLHASVVIRLGPTARGDGVWVYDLRVDPDEWLERSDQELKVALETGERLPVKPLQFNRAPAVAPLSVLDDGSRDRLAIDMAVIEQNREKLKGKNLTEFLERALLVREQRFETAVPIDDPDGQLYDGFLSDADRAQAARVAQATKTELAELQPQFTDTRLQELFVRYKARNYPELLKQTETLQWETYRQARLHATYGLNIERFYQELHAFGQTPDLNDQQNHVLTELDLWGQSLMPSEPANT